MAKNLKEIIEAEVRTYKDEMGSEWYVPFYNNFDGLLPGGYKRDEVYAQMYGFRSKDSKFRQQTLGEFYEVVDKIIEELGMTPEEIVESRKKAREPDNPSERDLSFWDKILPIYIKLREMGYSESDLYG